MTADEIKALRKELACTAKELAFALSLEQATVLAWERAELFPTRQYIERMEALRRGGPGAIPRKSKGGGAMRALADPTVWALIRKIVAHPKLREETARLAASYPDPSDD